MTLSAGPPDPVVDRESECRRTARRSPCGSIIAGMTSRVIIGGPAARVRTAAPPGRRLGRAASPASFRVGDEFAGVPSKSQPPSWPLRRRRLRGWLRSQCRMVGPSWLSPHGARRDRRSSRCIPVSGTAGYGSGARPAGPKPATAVVAYDRRGFGDTVYVAEPHDDLDDLMAVTAETDARPAVVVGQQSRRWPRPRPRARPPRPRHRIGADRAVSIGVSVRRLEGSIDAETEQDALIEHAEEAGDLDEVNRLEVRYWLDGVEQAEGRVQGPPRALMLDMNGRALAAEPIGDAAERAPAWPRLDRDRGTGARHRR